MSEARYLVGDVFDRMAELEDGSVDLILTSPPFLALRSYLPADHPLKSKEIGSEPTPAAFLDTLLALTAEWRRLLAPHGSICVELGDTYAGGNSEDKRGQVVKHSGPNPYGASTVITRGSGPDVDKGGSGWPLAKSLCGIPHLYHLSLAYGRNLLTGEPSPAGSWRVRNVVAWCRPNPPVGALGDKYRPATSYMTVACVSGQRYFDLDAVREARPDLAVTKGGNMDPRNQRDDDWRRGHKPESGGVVHPAGAPPLDWWEIPTQPSSEPRNGRLVRVPLDAAGGGIRRTTSPSCPQHGSPDRPGSSGPDGGRVADRSSRNGRTAARHAPTPLVGSPPTLWNTDQPDEDAAPAALAATPRSNPSRRTAPVPATTPAGTPSARSSVRTDGTPAEPESSSPHPGTPESSTDEDGSVGSRLDTPPRIAGTPDPSSACTCSFYVEALIPQDTSHYAGWPVDHWIMPTQGYPGAHYATWPAELCRKPIESMCPRRVCRVCGQPSRRIVEATGDYSTNDIQGGPAGNGLGSGRNGDPGRFGTAANTTLGWSDCGHDEWRNGLVLDPFAGSGTTLAVATGHGRDAIGIDLDRRNAELAYERIGGLFLEVDWGEVPA